MSVANFKNVALIAATGNLGSKILNSLRTAGFNVTAIQRKGSKNQVGKDIKSIPVDLTNKEDLVAAFKGQDVVVSAVPEPQYDDQIVMIDAAIEAGVKRIVPSEYSSNLETKAKDVMLPHVADKIRTRQYLEKVVKSSKIEWNSVNNGPFFDMSIKYGFFGPNVHSKKATFHDGGNKGVCTTSTDDIADAVVKSLKHREETRNKPVYVYSAFVNERQLTDLVSKITGIQFEIVHANVDKDADEYLEKLGKNKAQAPAIPLYLRMMFSDGYGGDYRNIAMNKTIGLRVMSETEIEGTVRSWLKETGF